MSSSNDLVSWIVLGGCLSAIFAGMGWVIKRVLTDKKYYSNVQFVCRQVYERFQNADRQANIEHVIHMEEEKKQDFVAGDDEAWK